MLRVIWLVLLTVGIGAAQAVEPGGTDIGVDEVRDLGQLNGQALACRQFEASRTAKALLIRHAPKTRTYGALFESATNAAFVAQAKDPGGCPSEIEVGAGLSELSARLEQVFPGGMAPAPASTGPDP
jgi:hypothetical protein